MNFNLKVILGVALLIAAALGAILFLGGGEAKEVEAVLREAFEAARRGDSEGVIRHISPRYDTPGTNYEEACMHLRGMVGPGKYQDLELNDLDISAMGESARATCTLKIVQPKNLPLPFINRKLLIDLRKEQERWMVIAVEAPAPER